jgi:hypothetical protein
MAQHKWHKEIKWFIDGGDVERKNINGDVWYLITDIGEFSIDYMDYRIKPQPKEPQYLYVYHGKTSDGGIGMWFERQQVPYIEGGYIGKIKLEQE